MLVITMKTLNFCLLLGLFIALAEVRKSSESVETICHLMFCDLLKCSFVTKYFFGFRAKQFKLRKFKLKVEKERVQVRC